MKNKKNRTDKQINIRFTILMVGGMILGGLIGFGGALLSDMYGGDIMTVINKVFKVSVPIVYVLAMVIAYSMSFVNYKKAKKMLNEWNGDEEEVLEEVDKKIALALEPISVLTVCNFFLYTGMTYISGIRVPGIELETYKAGLPLLVTGVAIFLANFVAIMIVQKKLIEMTKKINPEKQGNILDTDFNKVWMESCDESEKQAVYKAGYSAYQAGSYACIVMWLLALVAMMLFDTGIFPSVCVFVISITLNVSYIIACHKNEEKK